MATEDQVYLPLPILTWPEIEAVAAKFISEGIISHPYPERLLYTLVFLYDPELYGYAVSRDYMRILHALLEPRDKALSQ